MSALRKSGESARLSRIRTRLASRHCGRKRVHYISDSLENSRQHAPVMSSPESAANVLSMSATQVLLSVRTGLSRSPHFIAGSCSGETLAAIRLKSWPLADHLILANVGAHLAHSDYCAIPCQK